MTLALNLIASGSEVEWSRTLMIAWLVTVLGLSIIEMIWLKGGFSSRRLSPVRSDDWKRFNAKSVKQVGT